MKHHGETSKPRGFAAMSPERRSLIAGMGGRAAQKLGVAHRWVAGSTEAKEAGRKGGSISRRRKRNIPFSNDNSRH